MSSTQVSIEGQAATGVRAGAVDLKLEVFVIPVADVDRAKRFYTGLGWRERGRTPDQAAGDATRHVERALAAQA